MTEKEQQKTDDDKQFYRDMVKELISISKVNSENVKENNKIVQELSGNIQELKIALQSKPCIVGTIEDVMNKGWQDSVIKTYHYIIGGLFALLAGVLGAIGLYKSGGGP